MKLKLTISIFAALLPLWLGAQTTDALSFTRYDFGADISGTAGAAITAPGIGNAFHGASALAFSSSEILSAVEYRRRDGLSDVAAAFAYNKGNFALGAGYAGFIGNKVASYTTKSRVINLAAAYRITDKLSAGANIRYAVQHLTSDAKYSGVSFDASLMYKPMEALSIMAGASTIGTQVSSSAGDKYNQPSFAFAGAGYVFKLNPIDIALDAEAEYYFSGKFSGAAGVRIGLKDTFFLRGGYRFGSEGCVNPPHFAAGAGAKYKGLEFDLTYSNYPGSKVNVFAAGLCYSL